MSNPLVAKEVMLGLRKTRAAVLQVLFLGACFLATWALWPQGGVYSLRAQSSHRLLTVLGIAQLALVALFAPAFASTALTMEKERNTLDSLYGTRLSPLQIVWGKIVGSLMFLLMVILSGVPVLSVSLVLGGVAAESVAWLYAITVLTALSFGMLGLTVSALCERTYRSVVTTYVLIAALSGAVVLPALLLLESAVSLRTPLHVLRSLSPFTALVSVIEPGLLRRYTWEAELAPAHLIFCASNLGLTFVLGVTLCILLRRCPAPRSHPAGQIHEKFLQGFKRFPFYLIDPSRRRKMIGPLSNPVMVKELRTMLFGRLHYIVRSFYACVTASMALTLAAAFSVHFFSTKAIATLTVCLQAVLFLFIVPILSSTLICGEIEGKRFDLLRLTRLSSWRIVSGKLLAILLPLVILMIATLPPYLILARIDPDPRLKAAVVRSSVTMLSMLVFLSLVGIFFSSMGRRTAFSIAATYVVVVLTCVGGVMGLLGFSAFSRGTLYIMFVINPIVTVLGEVALSEKLEGFNLWGANLAFLWGASLVLLGLTVLRVRRLIRPE